MVENIVGKGENAGFQHFLLFHNVFKRLLSQGRQKLRLCSKGLSHFGHLQKLSIWVSLKFCHLAMCHTTFYFPVVGNMQLFRKHLILEIENSMQVN